RDDKERQKCEAEKGQLVRNRKDAVFHSRSGFLMQTSASGASDELRKIFGQRRNRAARFIQGNPLDPHHGKKQSRQSDAVALGVQYLDDEIVKRTQIDTPHLN